MPRNTAFYLLFMSTVLLHADPPKVNYFFPTGVRAGGEQTITASGAFGKWPVKVAPLGAGLVIEPAADKGKLVAKAAADALPGIHWVRLYDADGAAPPRPFFVGTIAELAEKEPNDSPAEGQRIELPAVVTGTLEKGGDVDVYAVSLKAGQTLVASMTANMVLKSPMDGILQICSPAGFVLEANDDGRGRDPQLVFSAPRDGSYLVRTFAFPADPNSTINFAGANNYLYRLTLTTGPFIDHTMPLSIAASGPANVEVFGWNIPDSTRKLTTLKGPEADLLTVAHREFGNAALVPTTVLPVFTEAEKEGANEIKVPAVVSGRLDRPGDTDLFSFSLAEKQKVRIAVQSRSLGYPLDAVLRVKDATGQILERVDDGRGEGERRGRRGRREERDPELELIAKATGIYTIEISDLHQAGGLRYVYQLTLDETKPSFSIEAAAAQYTIEPGKPIEIPLTIDRRDGFDAAVEITAQGLPNGVAAEPLSIAAKTREGKLKLAGNPTSAAQTAISILGKSAAKADHVQTAEAKIDGMDATTPQIWLTVLEPKKPEPKKEEKKEAKNEDKKDAKKEEKKDTKKKE